MCTVLQINGSLSETLKEIIGHNSQIKVQVDVSMKNRGFSADEAFPKNNFLCIIECIISYTVDRANSRKESETSVQMYTRFDFQT